MIDDQQVKYKINILFSASRSFAVPVSRSSWIGGGWSKKRQPGRADFGEVVRPAYPKQYPHLSNNVPHTPNNTLISPITSRISPSHHTPPHLSNNVPHTPNNTLILPITSRISSSPNIPHTSSQPYHPPSHLICYICDIIKT